MDNNSERIFYPTSLIDLLFQQAAQSEQQRQPQRAKGRAKKRSSGDCSPAPPNKFMLVEKDRLFHYIVTSSPDITVSPTSQIKKVFAKMAQSFRTLFCRVWDQIPELDQQQILAYWRQKSVPNGFAERAETPRAKPLIEISMNAGETSVEFNQLGHHLVFPDNLLSSSALQQSCEVARTLAQVHRIASGEHWKRVVEMIEEPIACWEREQGGRATEKRRDKKLDLLEADYLESFEKGILDTLRRWRFETTNIATE